MKNTGKIILVAFFATLFIGQEAYTQNLKKYIGFEYKNTKDVLTKFVKLPSTFFNQEMTYAIEIFQEKDGSRKYLFFQRYFTVEGNQSHRKILDIIALKLEDKNVYYSAVCFPNTNQQKDIIFGLYYTKSDLSSSQINVTPVQAWKTVYSKNKLEPMNISKLRCFFGTPDDFPG